jgi:hypothetical protein
MNPKHKRYLSGILSILLGLFILLVSNRMLSSELNFRKYERALLQVGHSPGTSLVDSFRLEASFYPATFVDEAIQFKSVYLVGELRRYAGDWYYLENFYNGMVLEDGKLGMLRVMILPVEIHAEGQHISFNFASDFAYSPFDSDMLGELQHYYDLRGMPQSLGGMERNLYLVYITPDTQP